MPHRAAQRGRASFAHLGLARALSGLMELWIDPDEGHQLIRVREALDIADFRVNGGRRGGPTSWHCGQGTVSGLVALVYLLLWLQYCVASSGLSMRGAEQSTEAFAPYHTTRVTSNASLRCEEPVGEPLMMALGMSVGEVWVDRVMERWRSWLACCRQGMRRAQHPGGVERKRPHGCCHTVSSQAHTLRSSAMTRRSSQ